MNTFKYFKFFKDFAPWSPTKPTEGLTVCLDPQQVFISQFMQNIEFFSFLANAFKPQIKNNRPIRDLREVIIKQYSKAAYLGCVLDECLMHLSAMHLFIHTLTTLV